MEKNKTSLEEIFKSLCDKRQYKHLIKTLVAKITLGSSIIRAFGSGTKPYLLKAISDIEVDDILKIETQEEYNSWHVKVVNKIYSSLIKIDKNIDKYSSDGLKWGHSTKIWNIYIGLLIFYSHYFNPSKELDKIKFYLHVPLDKKVFDTLRACKLKEVPLSIKSVEKEKYLEIQRLLREASSIHNLPPFYFDEYAWSFDEGL